VENDKFQLQNVAKTVEIAASSSKMLQIARKTDRQQIKKKNKTEKKVTQGVNSLSILIRSQASVSREVTHQLMFAQSS